LLTTGCPPFLRPVVVGRERVARGCGGGAGGGGGGARAGPAAGRAVRRSGPAPALAPFPVPGRSSLWTASCCWGGWLVLLLRGCNACRAVGGGLQSGAALIGVRLDVGSLPPRSSSLTVTGCRLGGFPVRRDRWGGERVVGGVLPRISVGTWGLCARLCLVLVCGGRYGLGEGFFSSSWDRVWAE
jgi:hypothetical protein